MKLDRLNRKTDSRKFINLTRDKGRIHALEKPFCPERAIYIQDLLEGSAADTAEEQFFGDVTDLLLCSPAARLMLDEAARGDWAVTLGNLSPGDRDGNDYHLDVPRRVMTLDSHNLSPAALADSAYFSNVLGATFIRALRDVWQEKRHGGFEEYGPEAVLMLERVRAADCDALTILVGWELRGEGCPEIWRYLIGSDKGDMAMAFSGALDNQPASAFTGRALYRAFAQWYADEARINACDHETLEYMDETLAALGAQKAFGRKKLTPVAVEILSCLPDRSAYLLRMGDEILRDPRYAGLGDPINQSHFMHLLYDLQVTRAGNVPFRDPALAAKIFPPGEAQKADIGEF